jgi:hypothetical protein
LGCVFFQLTRANEQKVSGTDLILLLDLKRSYRMLKDHDMNMNIIPSARLIIVISFPTDAMKY